MVCHDRFCLYDVSEILYPLLILNAKQGIVQLSYIFTFKLYHHGKPLKSKAAPILFCYSNKKLINFIDFFPSLYVKFAWSRRPLVSSF